LHPDPVAQGRPHLERFVAERDRGAGGPALDRVDCGGENRQTQVVREEMVYLRIACFCLVWEIFLKYL